MQTERIEAVGTEFETAKRVAWLKPELQKFEVNKAELETNPGPDNSVVS